MSYWDNLPKVIGALAKAIPGYVTGWINNHKSQPGDPGYFDPGSFTDTDWIEANTPGLNNVARVAQNSTYWADYKKNTGKSPRYPALQMGGGSISNLNPYDWWR